MAVQIQIREETAQACLSGEIDHHSAAQMREKIDESVIQSGAKTLVLDFSLVTFMDSSGIGISMVRYRKISCFGGHVYAIHADRQIQRIFRMSGLHKIVKILPG